MSWDCLPYETSMRGELVQLWNDVFEHHRNFVPMTRALWRDRIERIDEAFDPDFFRVATSDRGIVGFAHGGIWGGEFLRHLVPENDPESGGFEAMGYLAMVAVHSERRRQGVGASLIGSLRALLGERFVPGTPLVADGRMYNPHYGNFFAPVPPLWGTTEGAAVPLEDESTARFLSQNGFGESARAVSMVADLTQGVPRSGSRLQALGATPDFELVEDDNYQAILGSTGGNVFPIDNHSHTWVAVEGDKQIGTLIAYPFDLDSPAATGSSRATRWGVHSFEVDASYRGRGVGKAILTRALERMASFGAREVETLVLPTESPGAAQLYRSLGFEELASWIVFS